jgi:threonyl-tRNA synthetase
MGEACEKRYEGCCLGYGPPLEEGGFFYDMALGGERTISQEDYKPIEDVVKATVKEKQPFERLELPKEVLLEMFRVSGESFAATIHTWLWDLSRNARD